MASLRFRLRQKYWAWRAPSNIRGYLARSERAKLQIGAGPNPLPGWLNTTLYPFAPGTTYLDATKPFPLPDNSLDFIFSEHVIEHLEFAEAGRMLDECRRALKPGGKLRLATPDLARIIALYTQPHATEQSAYIRWIMDTFRPGIGGNYPAHVINQSFHGWRHKFIYDHATLVAALEAAGFAKITRQKPGESADPELRDLERHGVLIGNDAAMRYETMILEATNP